jgi:hypothetical protein
MNLLRILHAALASALFIFSPPASAAVSPSAALVSPDSAAVSDKKQRQRSSSAAPSAAGARRNTEVGAHAEGPLRPRASGRPRTAVAASRHGAASTAAQTIGTGGAPRASSYTGFRAVNPSPGRTNLSQGPASAMRNGAAPRATVALPQNSAARTGTLGGPRAQEHARLGGPSLGKPAHAAALDGTQMLRRKY